MSIYIWDKGIKNLYVWDSSAKEVYLWDTKIRPPVPKYKTFTISWTEQSNMSSWWTYSDDATWLTAWDTAFDDFFGYSAVLLNTSGVETAEMTQSWWVFTGAMTTLGNITSWDNVMIKFPLRWIKMTKSWSVVTLSITDEPNKDGYQYYAHTDSWTIDNPWTPKDAFYLWAYKWFNNSNVLKSWSGAYPTSWQTQATWCTYAKNNWTWYNIEWYYQRMYVWALYMMKYWNPNCKSVVWMWYPSNSSAATTWGTNSQLNATYWTSSNVQMKLFWLEDRWGSRMERVWWVYTDASYILNTQLGWYSWTTSWWTSIWVYAASTWCIYQIWWTNKSMFTPINSISDSWYSTYYCNYVYWYTRNRLLWMWAWGVISWWFYFYANATGNTTNNYVWWRLMYL